MEEYPLSLSVDLRPEEVEDRCYRLTRFDHALHPIEILLPGRIKPEVSVNFQKEVFVDQNGRAGVVDLRCEQEWITRVKLGSRKQQIDGESSGG